MRTAVAEHVELAVCPDHTDFDAVDELVVAVVERASPDADEGQSLNTSTAFPARMGLRSSSERNNKFVMIDGVSKSLWAV